MSDPICPRCHKWRVTHHVTTGDEYERTCISCLTQTERAAIDAAELKTGNLEEPAHA